MKKFIIVCSLTIAMVALQGMTKQDLLRTITSTHTRAFDRANMYDKPLDNSDLQKWDETIIAVSGFMNDNSRKNKKQLQQYLNIIQATNMNLINSIKAVYGQLKGKESNKALFQEYVKKFTGMENQMKTVQKSLEWIGTKDGAEEEVIAIIAILAKFIAVTARKAYNNLLIFLE